MAKLPLPKSYSTDFQNPRVKPVGDVEIDWNNPIARGLKFYPVFVGSKAIDLVSGQTGVNTGTITGGVTKEGRVIISGGTAQIAFADVYHGIGTGAFTQLVRFNWDGDGSSFQTSMSLPTINEVGMYTPQASNGVFSSDGDASGTIVYSPELVTQDQFDTFSICKGDGSSTQDGFVNGILQSGGEVRNFVEGGTTGITLFNGQGSEYGHGEILFAALWNRKLTDAEQLQMFLNPYQILKPKAAPVYWTVGGAGGISLTAETQDHEVTFFNTSIDLTGAISVSAALQAHEVTFFDATVGFSGEIAVSTSTQSHNVTFYDAVMDFTGEVEITTQAQDFDVTFYNATIGLVGGISVNTQVQAVNVEFHAATIGLFGVITVGAQKQSYNTTFYNVSIAIADVWTDKAPAITNWTDK